MLPMLSELKVRRKQLGITQSELALQTGVSQSLIAKIESVAVVPSYENAKKLFDYLERTEEKNQVNAADLMNEKIVSIDADSPIKKAVRLMETHSISQLPVLRNGAVVGTVHEKDVLGEMGKSKDPGHVGEQEVESIMTEALPQISQQTPFKVVSALMQHNDAVLVMQKGKICGILSKSDLLRVLLNQKRKLVQF